MLWLVGNLADQLVVGLTDVLLHLSSPTPAKICLLYIKYIDTLNHAMIELCFISRKVTLTQWRQSVTEPPSNLLDISQYWWNTNVLRFLYIIGLLKKKSWTKCSSGLAVPYMIWIKKIKLMFVNQQLFLTFMVQAALSYLFWGIPYWVQSKASLLP